MLKLILSSAQHNGVLIFLCVFILTYKVPYTSSVWAKKIAFMSSKL